MHEIRLLTVNLSRGDRTRHFGPGENLPVTNHEEADTRMVLHVLDSAKNSDFILVKTGDSDILPIFLGVFHQIEQINQAVEL